METKADNDGGRGLSFSDIWETIKRNIVLILICVAITVIAGMFIINFFITPAYKSEGAVLLSISSIRSEGSADDSVASVVGEDEKETLEEERLKIGTVVDFMQMDVVLSKVVEDIHGYYSLGEIKDMVDIVYMVDSYFIRVSCVAPSPEYSKMIVNSVINNAVAESSNSGISEYARNMQVFQYAVEGTSLSLKIPVSILILIVLGSSIALVIVVIKELTANQFHQKNEVETMLGMPIVSSIYDFKQRGSLKKNISKYNEISYGKLQQSIEYSNRQNPPKVVMITSTVPEEGKTTTVANLAKVIAKKGLKTLAIDLDLRRPQLAKHFDVQPRKGIVDLLGGAADVSDVICNIGENLDFITAGTRIDDPGYLFKSNKLKSFLQLAAENYDYVLIDTTPVVVYSDAIDISNYVDAVVYTVALTKTKKDDVVSALEDMKKARANIIGINMTYVKFDRRKIGYYY